MFTQLEANHRYMYLISREIPGTRPWTWDLYFHIAMFESLEVWEWFFGSWGRGSHYWILLGSSWRQTLQQLIISSPGFEVTLDKK